eukprot:TRINITY_DN11429_c0_g1_i2.p1 TRINITY_DN11429_c0_g1~~TRINITY_DN11429_c0_g1_i2.p1  ORF type:complete len:243 (+),score=53.81 TRINITY_DN11429_c0_g1_i2:160-888(+)
MDAPFGPVFIETEKRQTNPNQTALTSHWKVKIDKEPRNNSLMSNIELPCDHEDPSRKKQDISSLQMRFKVNRRRSSFCNTTQLEKHDWNSDKPQKIATQYKRHSFDSTSTRKRANSFAFLDANQNQRTSPIDLFHELIHGQGTPSEIINRVTRSQSTMESDESRRLRNTRRMAFVGIPEVNEDAIQIPKAIQLEEATTIMNQQSSSPVIIMDEERRPSVPFLPVQNLELTPLISKFLDFRNQ